MSLYTRVRQCFLITRNFANPSVQTEGFNLIRSRHLSKTCFTSDFYNTYKNRWKVLPQQNDRPWRFASNLKKECAHTFEFGKSYTCVKMTLFAIMKIGISKKKCWGQTSGVIIHVLELFPSKYSPIKSCYWPFPITYDSTLPLFSQTSYSPRHFLSHQDLFPDCRARWRLTCQAEAGRIHSCSGGPIQCTLIPVNKYMTHCWKLKLSFWYNPFALKNT